MKHKNDLVSVFQRFSCQWSSQSHLHTLWFTLATVCTCDWGKNNSRDLTALSIICVFEVSGLVWGRSLSSNNEHGCKQMYNCLYKAKMFAFADFLRVLERLQASWLWRGGWSPPDTTSPLLWKPSWGDSSTPSTSEPAWRLLGATTPAWGGAEGGGLKSTIRPGSRVRAGPSAVSGGGERGGSVDGSGWGGRGAHHTAPACDRRLRDWSLCLPAGCGRGLGAWGGKRRRAPDVQGRWRGLLLRAPAADLQTEGAHLWAAQPDRQHQHWRPHGVIHDVTNQPTSAAFCFTLGDTR